MIPPIETPLILLYEDQAKRIFAKDETKQISNAFKYRGVLNKMQCTDFSSHHGIITASTGNHGTAVAIAAESLGIPCVVVVPESVPVCKKQNITRHGAMLLDKSMKSYEECKSMAMALSEENAFLYIPSFDDHLIIAGHQHIFEEATKTISFDACFCPVGGGGLVAAAIRHKSNLGQIVGVEWDQCPAMKCSLEAGKRVVSMLSSSKGSICEGIVVSQVGEIPFQYASEYCLPVTLVSEQEIENAIRELYKQNIIAEGAGAASFAAAMKSERVGNILCTISGGNIDRTLLAEILRSELQ